MARPEKPTEGNGREPSRLTRRDFLKLSAMGAVGCAGLPVLAGAHAAAGSLSETGRKGTANTMPGRIVILHDIAMGGHLASIDRTGVGNAVHRAVRLLAGIDDTGDAFESLFPGLKDTSTFAVKVNCIGPTDTPWQVASAIVEGLSLMRGGGYDVSRVVVYDRHNLSYHGYEAADFTFGGHAATLSSNNQASGSGYPVWESHLLSQFLLDCDYVINLPVLKSHYDANNQITVSLKNHYGSCSPSSLCGDIPGMLTLNADANVRGKTGLVLTSAIRATYNGGPGEPAQLWSLYSERTPNTIFATTDPVTNDYWSRDLINRQRSEDGLSVKPCPWVETASEPAYDIGVSDPAAMDVVGTLDVSDGAPSGENRLSLAPNTPNPFSHSTTIRFHLPRPGRAELRILDVRGRVVRTLKDGECPAGTNALVWDARNDGGRPVAPGVYFARLRAGALVRTGRLVLAR